MSWLFKRDAAPRKNSVSASSLIGYFTKGGVGGTAPSQTASVAPPSPIGLSGSITRETSSALLEQEEVPLTDDMAQYVECLCDGGTFFNDFPTDVDASRQFTFGPAQERHALAAMERIPALAKCRQDFCSKRPDSEFWYIYFTVIRQHFRTSHGAGSAAVSISQNSPGGSSVAGTSVEKPSISTSLSLGSLGSLGSLTIGSLLKRTLAGSQEQPPPVVPTTDEERQRAIKAVLQTKEILSEDLKQEIRKGLMHARGKLWTFVTGCSMYLLDDPYLFEDTMKRVHGTTEMDPLLGDIDFGGHFREEDHPSLRDEDLLALKNILHLVGSDMSEETFLPFAPDLIALLLQVLPAPKAFTTSHIMLLKSVVNGKFFPTTRSGHSRDQAAFERCIRQCVPPVYSKMEELGVDVSEFAVEWFDRLFVGNLPPEAILRVADCFFSEGRTVLYAVGIALLLLYQETLISTETPEAFLAALKSATLGVEDAGKLIEVSFEVPITDADVDVGPILRPDALDLGGDSNTIEEAKPAILDGAEDETMEGVEDIHETEDMFGEYAKIPNPSAILSGPQFEFLCEWLPARLLVNDPKLPFTSSRDGFNLSRVFHKCEGLDSLVLVIESTDHNVFGAFIPNILRPTPGRYYGTGEAFLFSMTPTPEKFDWVPGNNSFFLLVENRSLTIGGGGGAGLWMDDELNNGMSQRCDTFRNKPLNYSGEEFKILHVEIICFNAQIAASPSFVQALICGPLLLNQY